jgi:uncharacterized protein (DUF362 family)
LEVPTLENERKTKRCNLSRRDFLKSLSGAAASAVILGSCESSKTSKSEPRNEEPTVLSPRSKSANPFINQAGMPLLVCVTGTDFKKMLTAGLSQLGGLSKLISANQDVLIKPNCNASNPYPGITDLNSLLSIIREVKKVTGGTISVGDQGWAHSSAVYVYSGMDPHVEQEGAVLLNLSDTYRVRHSNWASNVPDFNVYSDIYDAPIIINTCVLKRHHTAVYSCAIKNNVGTVAGPEAVSTRHYLHYESGDFMSTVVQIAEAVNPELNIVDARTVLTVAGPDYYDGIPVDVNKIVICGDIVATDAYCAEILADHDNGFTTDMALPIIGGADASGLGRSDLSKVEVIEITV